MMIRKFRFVGFKFQLLPFAGMWLLFNLLTTDDSQAQDLFPDKNLEAVVRREVFEKRESKDPLTAKDVENISQIKGIGKGIKNLKGLEACVSLRSIWLDNNEITDLSPLKDLKLIQQLMLKNNQIKDIKPIAGLVMIQHLDLEKNQISDISPIAKFDNMKSLYLGDNQIKDLSVVAQFKKIWSLYVPGNPITDLKPVSQLRFLDRLDISNTPVADLGPLAGLKSLNRLMLENSKVTDLTVLVEMAKKDAASESRFAPFWKLHLKGCPLTDTAKDAQVKELEKLGAKVYLD